MQYLKFLLIIWAIMLAFAIAACGRKRAADFKASNVFFDLVYVGSGPYSPEKNGGINMTVAPHGKKPLAFPSQLETGVEYIFHHRKPLDNEKFALTELPLKLRQQGIDITRGPRSVRDMVSTYIGGPVFSLQFKEGAQVGIIFSQVCSSYTKQVDTGFTGNDYVLVYIK